MINFVFSNRPCLFSTCIWHSGCVCVCDLVCLGIPDYLCLLLSNNGICHSSAIFRGNKTTNKIKWLVKVSHLRYTYMHWISQTGKVAIAMRNSRDWTRIRILDGKWKCASSIMPSASQNVCIAWVRQPSRGTYRHRQEVRWFYWTIFS